MLSAYTVTVLITIGIYVILALSLNLITGYAGQISLGHAAFFGMGAYTAALASTKLDSPFLLNLVLAAATAGLVGAVLGIPCLRVRDDFLAITTMGIGFVVEAVFLYSDFFGGAMGIGNIAAPTLLGVELGKLTFLLFILGVILAVVGLDRWLSRAWVGLAWASIREDETAAGAAGVDIVRFKVFAFVAGSAIAGVAGALYAHFLTFIMASNFGFGQSILILSMVVLGGIGTIRGPLVGAIVLGALPEISRPLLEYRTLLYGVLLMLCMRFQPQGLLGEGSLIWNGALALWGTLRPSGRQA
jgi:branched-chain amino acid transport system permease protein